MEVIRLPGYTPEEKIEIARSFLIPRQIEEHGLPGDAHPLVARGGRSASSRDYTDEAGVRNLERQVAAICRKVARRAAEGDASARARDRAQRSPRFLGPPRHLDRRAEPASARSASRTGSPGPRRGGEVLRVEVDDDAGTRPRADRPARRRDEGVRAGGAHLGARVSARARTRRRAARAPPGARARAGGRDPEGRSLGRRRRSRRRSSRSRPAPRCAPTSR